MKDDNLAAIALAKGFRLVERLDLHSSKYTIVPDSIKGYCPGWEEITFDRCFSSGELKLPGDSFHQDNDEDENHTVVFLAAKEGNGTLELLVAFQDGRLTRVTTNQQYTIFWAPENSAA